MFCSRCGTSLADGSQFCVECGHTIEGSFPAAPAPGGEVVCGKCGKNILPGARFCSNCGNAAPPRTITVIGSDGSAAAATATAYEPIYLRRRRTWSTGRLMSWFVVLVVLGAAGWILATNNAIAPQIKSYLTTAHVETITETSVAIKPHGFATYRVTVPQGAIDVAVTGRFEASGRAERDVEALLVSEAELIVWQSGYSVSAYYDSGKVSQAALQAPLPPRVGTYYLIISNKPSSIEKTVHISTVLHYNTWMSDSLVYVKEKIWSWFQ